MAKRDNKDVFDKNYFALPRVGWMMNLVTTIPFVVATGFNPDLIPPSLGVVRTASFYLAENYPNALWYMAASIPVSHTLEALYAFRLCWSAGMTPSATFKWTISTLLFGFSSLMLKLMPYLNNTKRHQP